MRFIPIGLVSLFAEKIFGSPSKKKTTWKEEWDKNLFKPQNLNIDLSKEKQNLLVSPIINLSLSKENPLKEIGITGVEVLKKGVGGEDEKFEIIHQVKEIINGQPPAVDQEQILHSQQNMIANNQKSNIAINNETVSSLQSINYSTQKEILNQEIMEVARTGNLEERLQTEEYRLQAKIEPILKQLIKHQSSRKVSIFHNKKLEAEKLVPKLEDKQVIDGGKKGLEAIPNKSIEKTEDEKNRLFSKLDDTKTITYSDGYKDAIQKEDKIDNTRPKQDDIKTHIHLDLHKEIIKKEDKIDKTTQRLEDKKTIPPQHTDIDKPKKDIENETKQILEDKGIVISQHTGIDTREDMKDEPTQIIED
ncbi:TPA: hypothetical protein DCX16_05280, partial [bacterium]|nr:hypothetical protein [bacterium]